MTLNSINWVLSKHSTGDYINEVFTGVVESAKATDSKSGKGVTFCEVADTQTGEKIKWTLFGQKKADLQGKEIEFIPARGKGTWIKLGDYNGEAQLDLGKEATWKVVGAPESREDSPQQSTPSADTQTTTQSHSKATGELPYSLERQTRRNLMKDAVVDAEEVRKSLTELGINLTPEHFQGMATTLFISLAQNYLPGKGFNSRKDGDTGVENCLPESMHHPKKWSEKEKAFFKNNEKHEQDQPEEPEPSEASGDDVPF